MKGFGAYGLAALVLSSFTPLYRMRHESLLPLFLLALLCSPTLGAASRLAVPTKPTASALHSDLPLPPRALSIPLSSCYLEHSVTRHMQERHKSLSSDRGPSYVVLNNEKDEFDALSLLSPPEREETNISQIPDRDGDPTPLHVFSFWQRPRHQAPVAAPDNVPSPRAETPAVPDQTGGESGTPVVLHFPPVVGGWARQADEEAADRAATAGAAVTCGDLLLVPLPLEALNGPASLTPQHQPLPLLLSALQLQLQLRTLEQPEARGTSNLPASLAAAANRTKPIVVLLRDPTARNQKAGHAEREKTNSTRTETDDPHVLRLTLAHEAMRLLEGQWKAMATELGVGLPHAPPSPSQQQPQDAAEQHQQQRPSDPLVPPFREFFSMHVIFLPRLPTSSVADDTARQMPHQGITASLRRSLRSLLMQHRQREAQQNAQYRLDEQHRYQQQNGVVTETATPREGDALWLFDAAAAACKTLVAAPESARQPLPLLTSPHTGAPQKTGETVEVAAGDAAAFDATIYRRRALARFRARIAEVTGPQEGYAQLCQLLREFDECCAASTQAAAHGAESSAVAAAAAIAEARQALEEEAVNDLRALHRLQLDALRSMTAQRFGLFLQQLVNGPTDNEGKEQGVPPQPPNFYDLSNRISDAIRQTADNFHGLIRDYHSSMDPKAVQRLLMDPDGQGQRATDRASAQEVATAISTAAAQERQLLLSIFREMAAAVLQQQQLLLVQQQRQRGFGILQRLQHNAQNKLLATRQGAALLRVWRRLRSTAGDVGRSIERLPLVHQLVSSPIADLWRKRKPVDISLHYLSPTAFGLADIKVPQVASAPELRKLRDSLTKAPPDAG